ncbi:MAG: FAD-dependent monooxygenase [Chitinophagales bacterium]|nr:FAD-dependent monooxygenase [Chitinophagales bacterium]
MTKQNKSIAIAGAGLVGSMWACFLANRGYDVHVFERRSDMRKGKVDAGRSINLALSTRGWHSLKKIGMEEELLKIAIPMHGRMIHQTDGTTDFQAYGKEGQSIYSISRGDLNMALMNKADENEHIHFHFNKRITKIDFDEKEVLYRGENNESDGTMQTDLVFGTDGAFSAVRYQLQKTPLFNYSQQYLAHGYKELSIPPNADGTHRIEKNALHIWPRKSFMLIALPNLDGSFTVTLFLQFKGAVSFESLNSDEKIKAFFQEYFPTALKHMPDLIQDFHDNPTSSLVTVKCDPWHYENACLLGDAAHAVVPFYGQGMNAGFEDCFVLNELVEQHHDKEWTQVFEKFSAKHSKNGHAIADLALRNFIEMRDATSDDHFLQRKKLELHLMRQFPGKYFSQYQLVTFTTVPYDVALKLGDKQTAFAESLLKQFPNAENWQSAAFNQTVEHWFKENPHGL